MSHFFQGGCQSLDFLCNLFSIYLMLRGSLLSLREDGFEWSAFPTDGAKLMIQKITKLRISSHWMDDPMMGHVFGPSLPESLRKKCDTMMWCLPKTLRCLSQKGREMVQREKMTWNGFWVSICVYLWIMLSPSFIVVVPSLWIMNSGIYGQWLFCHEWELLKYIAILLPLLCPLLFIINARNKCVTLARIVIDTE